MALALAFALSSCCDESEGEDTPTIQISEDGYWIINGVKTTYKAIGKDGTDGEDGQNGQDGKTPTIEVSEDGYWIINGIKTTYKAIGTDGEDGKTPTFTVSEDGFWVINGTKTEYKAIATDGNDGITPKLKINATTNEWEVSYDSGNTWVSLGIKASGQTGASIQKLEFDEYGRLLVTMTDS